MMEGSEKVLPEAPLVGSCRSAHTDRSAKLHSSSAHRSRAGWLLSARAKTSRSPCHGWKTDPECGSVMQRKGVWPSVTVDDWAGHTSGAQGWSLGWSRDFN